MHFSAKKTKTKTKQPNKQTNSAPAKKKTLQLSFHALNTKGKERDRY